MKPASHRAPIPWVARVLLLQPTVVAERLAEIARSGVVERIPNEWQIALGVLRMGHRLVFRSDTIGTCADHPVRATWRARLLAFRPFRFPFLLAERAIAPWDLSGLLSSRERVRRHLIGAHHDGDQFAYDLEMLASAPEELARVADEARAIVEDRHPRGEWLRDLVVFERYHEELLAAVEQALAGDYRLPRDRAVDPDISFFGYLAWCARQPATPAATVEAWRRRAFTFDVGLAEEQAPC